jgi:hypothetical protein
MKATPPLHNADGAGVFAWDDGSLAWPDHRKGHDYHAYEVMQMDAAMGAVTAIIEMLVSVRNGVIHVADRLPKSWRELAFERVRVEGGFLIDGCFRHGRADGLTVASTRGGTLRIAPALGEHWTLDGETMQEPLATLSTTAGQTLRLHRVDY